MCCLRDIIIYRAIIFLFAGDNISFAGDNISFADKILSFAGYNLLYILFFAHFLLVLYFLAGNWVIKNYAMAFQCG